MFYRSQRDAFAVDRANGSRKFPLRLDHRRHEMIDPPFRLG